MWVVKATGGVEKVVARSAHGRAAPTHRTDQASEEISTPPRLVFQAGAFVRSYRRLNMVRTIVLAACLLAGGLLCAAEPLRDRQEAAPAPLELRITAKEASLTLGQQPQITATLTNKGNAPVTLVLPGDGSESGWRTPLVGFSSIKLDKDKPRHPATVPLYRGARCGNVNALKSNEVFTLAPGKSQDLTDWIGSPSLPEPGSYSVVFYYANDPGLKWQGLPLGKHDPDALKRVEQSHKCLLLSNELRLTVKAKE
jgi:hypothetical protein